MIAGHHTANLNCAACASASACSASTSGAMEEVHTSKALAPTTAAVSPHDSADLHSTRLSEFLLGLWGQRLPVTPLSAHEHSQEEGGRCGPMPMVGAVAHLEWRVCQLQQRHERQGQM